MLEAGLYNMDCMEGMRQFPDGFFDLAVVDPPYGLNIAKHTGGKIVGGGTGRSAERTVYGHSRKAAARQNPITPSPTTRRRMKDILGS